MGAEITYTQVSTALLEWYAQNKRDLPWRHTKDPYLIWLSEIILQQTRVEQGQPYYMAFSNKYPKVEDLANASEDQVLKLWQGLGYYSRARNMHATAKIIVDKYQGKFPDTYQNIIDLKGVGSYTASAIASFAFDLPHAVLDGNVYRFLSRYFGVHTPIDSSKGKKDFQELADMVLNSKKPGIHNQAIMEFGALVCVPKKPKCQECIFLEKCAAYQKSEVNVLPLKAKKIKTRSRYFDYLLLKQEGSIFLNHRSGNDIWKGLFDFPLIESSTNHDESDLLKTELFETLKKDYKIHINNVSTQVKHKLSHQNLFIRFWEISLLEELVEEPDFLKSYKRVDKTRVFEFAVPIVIHNYIKTRDIVCY